MAIMVDFNKNNGEYFAFVGKTYIHGPDYGPVCREINRLGKIAKPTGKAIKAKKKQIEEGS